MTLEVPLAVRIGSRTYTRQVAGLRFRKEANGGTKSVSVRLSKPLSSLAGDTVAFEDISIFDTRTGGKVAGATLADPGRSASNEGQIWDLTGFGAAAHASDIKLPLAYVFTAVADGWRQVNRNWRGARVEQTSLPSDASDTSPDSIVFHNPEGNTASTSATVVYQFDTVRDIDMHLARVAFDWDGGSGDSDYQGRLFTSVDGAGGSASFTQNMNATGGSHASVVGTDFTNGRNVLQLVLNYSGSAAAPSTDNKWFAFYNLVIRTRLRDKDGTSLTTGYGQNYVLAHEVVKDLLGRCLPEYDGANAYIDTTAAHHIDHLAYVDGVTAAQVLDDLLAFEPGYRWRVVDRTGQFRWELLPTTPRYEATLEDGGEFPESAQTLFNEVTVRRRNSAGRILLRTRTAADAGVTDDYLGANGKRRRDMIDAGDEIGSPAGATRLADNFLADNAVPKNAGKLRIARPIRDLAAGRLVQPWEIEEGELIRVRGLESYPDALNASNRDGRTIFRISALDFDSDTAAADLELDTYPRTTAKALVRALTKRNRKR